MRSIRTLVDHIEQLESQKSQTVLLYEKYQAELKIISLQLLCGGIAGEIFFDFFL